MSIVEERIDFELGKIEERILRGRISKARSTIHELAKRKLDRSRALRLAQLARQAYWPEKAVQILHPLVRPSRASASAGATEEESAEYGMALADMGAGFEAIQILSRIDRSRLPRATAALAWARFKQWDWATAIPELRELTALPGLSDADRKSAELRLGTALLHGSDALDESLQVLGRLRDATRAEGGFFHQEAMWMIMQARFFRREWKLARKALEEAKLLHSEEERGSPVDLAFQQWEALIEFHAEKAKAALAKLRKVGAEFARLERWEKVRACQYYEAVCTRDEDLVAKLSFGTPYPAFRRKLLSAVGLADTELPTELHWEAPSRKAGARAGAPWVRVANGRNSLGNAYLKEGQVPQRLLHALCMDLYSPPKLIQLFERIYPDEHFDPGSSPLRIHEALRRLRLWLSQGRIPLAVVERKASYFIESPSRCALILEREDVAHKPAPPAALQEFTRKLRSALGSREFSSIAAADALGISRNSAIGHLREAASHGLAERMGAGPATRYRLSKL